MAQQTDKKPNILVIWGDDIGIANLSCYSHGLMGYQTPNIDRIAKEGMRFTDFMASSPVPRDAPRLSQGSPNTAPASPRSASPPPRRECAPKTRPSPSF